MSEVRDLLVQAFTGDVVAQQTLLGLHEAASDGDEDAEDLLTELPQLAYGALAIGAWREYDKTGREFDPSIFLEAVAHSPDDLEHAATLHDAALEVADAHYGDDGWPLPIDAASVGDGKTVKPSAGVVGNASDDWDHAFASWSLAKQEDAEDREATPKPATPKQSEGSVGDALDDWAEGRIADKADAAMTRAIEGSYVPRPEDDLGDV